MVAGASVLVIVDDGAGAAPVGAADCVELAEDRNRIPSASIMAATSGLRRAGRSLSRGRSLASQQRSRDGCDRVSLAAKLLLGLDQVGDPTERLAMDMVVSLNRGLRTASEHVMGRT